jgi:hypothetical protein
VFWQAIPKSAAWVDGSAWGSEQSRTCVSTPGL